MNNVKRLFLVLLAAIMCSGSIVGCASTEETDTPADISNPTAEVEETEAETEAPDPFADFDYNGQSFRVYTSNHNASATLVSSNFLIEGPEELTGEAAGDAAIERNAAVSELLNINMEFTRVEYGYDGVQNDVRTYIMAGADSYDLIVNDLYGLTGLTVEGMFHSADKGEYFDFTQPYWYGDFMNDIAFKQGQIFMMAGDFIIDTLRTGHCLVYNKNLYTDLYGNGDALYETVLNGEWTMDKMIELVEGAYLDTDGNGQKNIGDKLGFAVFQDWGPCIPFLITNGAQYVTRGDDGYPVIAMNNERTILMCDKIYELWNSQGTGALALFSDNNAEVLNQFSSGNVLIVGYQQLGSLESDVLRSAEYEIGVIPYPKLDELQENYITSAHDTSEIGLIPVTMPEDNISFVSACLEVLSRESHKNVLPLYYENSLKVKYTRDNQSAQMIDIIHDGLANSFALAWHQPLNTFLQSLIHSAAMNKDTFASKYATTEKALVKMLDRLITNYSDNNG
ncbi:MAG: hypothetical protein J6I42_06500 [Clostridia bacterium]|nr:hypothetical protein [Clostridia bacterium]MBO5126911.1 hypothetical protein [Clostridia bacterium]